MNFSAHRCRFLLIGAALVLRVGGSAQTLERRPPATSQSPGSPMLAEDKAVQTPANPLLPAGTSLQVMIVHRYPMKDGEAIEGRLLHSIYVDSVLTLPQNTRIDGKVVVLAPDKQMRWRARLHGDFTPFHTAEVRFDRLVLPSGPLLMTATTATHGAPVLHLTAPGVAPKQSFLSRQWNYAKNQMRDRVTWFTVPGFGGRALQMLYFQLPYHPEQIDAQTAWSFELAASLALPELAIDAQAGYSPTPMPAPDKPESWSVHALLQQDLTSASASPGDPVTALVVEPVYDKTKHLVVPQGATLIGKVTAARAARSFGRNGKLRFTFQQVCFSEGFAKAVEGTLTGAATEKTQNLQLDAEGTITPRNQSSAIMPLALTILAGRALDMDGNLTADTGVASNGFGLAGRVVGVAVGNRNLAAGLGFYAAGLSFYENFLRAGRDVVFPKDTRIEIETTPLRAPILKLATQ